MEDLARLVGFEVQPHHVGQVGGVVGVLGYEHLLASILQMSSEGFQYLLTQFTATDTWHDDYPIPSIPAFSYHPVIAKASKSLRAASQEAPC